jgi:hypothetical protein
MASDRCKCTLGSPSFIYCIHQFQCEAQGGVGRLSLATKTFRARQSFAEAKKLDKEYERTNVKQGYDINISFKGTPIKTPLKTQYAVSYQ